MDLAPRMHTAVPANPSPAVAAIPAHAKATIRGIRLNTFQLNWRHAVEIEPLLFGRRILHRRSFRLMSGPTEIPM